MVLLVIGDGIAVALVSRALKSGSESSGLQVPLWSRLANTNGNERTSD